MSAQKTTVDDLLRVALRGPGDGEKVVRIGLLEREVLDWLDCRPRYTDCDREQLRIDHATPKRVVDRLIEKGLIHEGPDIRCTGPESIYPEGDQLWLTARGVGALHRIEMAS